MRSILKGDLDGARQSLDDGAAIERGEPEHRPLRASIRHGHVDIVKLLLDRGAAPGRMPIHSALGGPFGADGGRLEEMIGLLLDAGACVKEIAGRGETALCIASSRGLLGVADLLLARGAAVDGLADGLHLHNADQAYNPLYYVSSRDGAFLQEKHEIAAFLLDRGAAVDGHPQSGAMLLQRFSADESPRPTGGCRTPLYEAIHRGQLDLARTLIDRGADELRLCVHTPMHQRNGELLDAVYSTPLALARQKGHRATPLAALFDPLPAPPRVRMMRHLRWRFLFHADGPGARHQVFTDPYLSAHLAEFLMPRDANLAQWNFACDFPAEKFFGLPCTARAKMYSFSFQEPEGSDSEPDEARTSDEEHDEQNEEAPSEAPTSDEHDDVDDVFGYVPEDDVYIDMPPEVYGV